MPIICAAILFDLDGVLLDSTENVVRHWGEWADLHHLDITEIMRVSFGRRTVETMRLVAPHLPVEEEALRYAAGEAVDTRGVNAIAGAAALLDTLPPDAWAIVTSGTLNVASARLRSQGLPIPRVLVTAEDVANGKPDPEPYLLAASRLGISADRCVVVEDSPAGIAAACAAGMRSVAVAFTHPPEELGEATAVAQRLADLRVESVPGGLSIRIAGDTTSDSRL